MLGKKHKVSVAMEDYIHLIMGEKKIGKSTLVAEIAKQYYGNIETLLCLSIGNEDGYNALDGLMYETPQTWNDFVAIVDELVQNPDDNPYKIISIDTIDELVKVATKEVMKQSKIETGKPCKSLNDCFGGYSRGKERLVLIIDDQLTRLKNSKYGIFLIGHNKVKTMKEKNSDEYSVLTSNLNSDQFNVFGYKSDIICNLVTEKETDENKQLTGTKRYMYFRSEGYVDAGSRFEHIPNRVEYGALNYTNAVEEGIKLSLSEKLTDKQIETEKSKQIEEKEIKAKKFAEIEAQPDVEEMASRVIQALKSSKQDVQKKFVVKLTALGFSKITDILESATIEQLRELGKIVDLEI